MGKNYKPLAIDLPREGSDKYDNTAEEHSKFDVLGNIYFYRNLIRY